MARTSTMGLWVLILILVSVVIQGYPYSFDSSYDSDYYDRPKYGRSGGSTLSLLLDKVGDIFDGGKLSYLLSSILGKGPGYGYGRGKSYVYNHKHGYGHNNYGNGYRRYGKGYSNHGNNVLGSIFGNRKGSYGYGRSYYTSNMYKPSTLGRGHNYANSLAHIGRNLFSSSLKHLGGYSGGYSSYYSDDD